jgi:RNA polymerase sigma-70 factor (ECF subfamily)
LRRDRPGPYQFQAAIQAVHADAATFEATDWRQIVALYDQLLAIAPTPVVALNRAIAMGEIEGPAAVLELLERLDLDGYYAFHAARADLLSRLDRPGEAATAFERAAELAPTEAERVFLRRGGQDRERPR